MVRNSLFLSATAALLAFAPAASAADMSMAPLEPEAGFAVGMAEGEQVATVEEDDGLGIDVNVDLGLFDDDDEEAVAVVHGDAPLPPAPYVTK